MATVLIHGGGMTARFWDRLVPLLPGDVVAVNLPGRHDRPADLGTITVDQEVASVLADIDRFVPGDGPIVVVAHSSGGLTVPGVVAGLAGRVGHVVLNAASIPPEGGCGLDCMQPRHREGIEWAMTEARKTGTVITTQLPSDPEKFRTTYGGDPLDDDTLAFVVDPVRLVADTVNHYWQPVYWSMAGDVPVTYVVNERDRPIPAALQDEMIARLPHPATVVRLDTGHIPPITIPERFAEIVRSAGSLPVD